jgi:hypothetical protein
MFKDVLILITEELVLSTPRLGVLNSDLKKYAFHVMKKQEDTV